MWCAGVIAPALAGEANYQPYVVGERAAGMGGAVAATADGMDACFYNPAGLGHEIHHSLSMNGTLYGLQRFKVKDAVFPEEDFDVSSFTTIPTGLSAVRKIKEGTVVAFSVFVPAQMKVREIQAYPERQHYYNFSQDDQLLLLGPSVGHVVNERLAVGASVFGLYQTGSRFENLFWGDYAFIYSGNFKYSVIGLTGNAGLQYQVAPEWSLGVVLTAPSATLDGSGRAHFGRARGSETVSGAASEYYEDLDAQSGLPAELRMGIGWRRPETASAGLDVTYHFSRSFDWLKGSQDGQETVVRRTREAVTDIQVGGEYIFRKRFPLRAGFFTSFSSAPDVDPDEPSSIAQIDLYGVTVSAGSIGENVVVNLGLSYVWGSGDSLGNQLNEQGALQAFVSQTSQESLYAFASTAYRF